MAERGTIQMDITLEDDTYPHPWLKATIGCCTFSVQAYESEAAARNASSSISQLPSDYFLQPSFVFSHENKHYLAYESFEQPLDQYIKHANVKVKRGLVRNIVDMSSELEKLGILHCNLLWKYMVVVNGKIKCVVTPDSKLNEASTQVKQIFELVKFVIQPNKNDEVQKDFFEKLRTAFSCNDLKSCLYHPYLAESYRQKLLHHASCMTVLLGVDDDTKSKFNDKFKHDEKDGGDWRKRLMRIGTQEMKRVYQHAAIDGVAYNTTAYSKHRFIRNYCQHTDQTDMEFVGEELETVFPNFLFELNDYMHTYDLHQLVLDKLAQGEPMIKNLERCLSQLFGEERQIFDSKVFRRSFDMFDFVLAKLYSKCLPGSDGSKIGREIRMDMKGYIDALNMEELDGKTFKLIISSLEGRMKSALKALIRYAKALVKCFCRLISASKASTIDVEDILVDLPWPSKLKDKVSAQLKHLPKRSVLQNILQPEIMSDESIVTKLDSLSFEEILAELEA